MSDSLFAGPELVDYRVSARAVPSFRTMNKKVAVEPFQDMAVKTVKHGQGAVGVARIENRISLTPLKVLFGTNDGTFREGDVVYVRSNLYTVEWAKERHEFEGKTFMLLPEQYVEAVIKST